MSDQGLKLLVGFSPDKEVTRNEDGTVKMVRIDHRSMMGPNGLSNHMNPARAREMAAAPDLKWSPELIKSLAQGYVDQAQAIMTFVKHIDNLERELTELGNLHTAACEELAEVKGILRGLYP